MSDDSESVQLMEAAGQAALRFDWLTAASNYQSVVEKMLATGELLQAVELLDEVGYAFFRAAMQAEDIHQLTLRLTKAAESFAKGAQIASRIESARSEALADRARALEAYCRFWLSNEPSQRKAALDECHELAKRALTQFEKSGDKPEILRTCRDILNFSSALFDLEISPEKRARIIEESFEVAGKAVAAPQHVAENHVLAEIYALASLHHHNATHELQFERREASERQMSEFCEEALKLSQKMADPYLVGLAGIAASFRDIHDPHKGSQSALVHSEIVAKQGEIARDHYLRSMGLSLTAFCVWRSALVGEDPEAKKYQFQKVIAVAKSAIDHLERISLLFWIPWIAHCYPYEYQIRGYASIAKDTETDLQAKRGAFIAAIEAGRRNLALIERSGNLWLAMYVLAPLRDALVDYSMIASLAEKQKSLEEALQYSKRTVEISSTVSPYDLWRVAEAEFTTGLVTTKLSELPQYRESQAALLEDATARMGKALDLYPRSVRWPQKEFGAARGWIFRTYADALLKLRAVKHQDVRLRETINLYKLSSEHYQNAGASSRVAEVQWQIAKVYDMLGEYSDAAAHFEAAASNYESAASSISAQLKEFYEEYANFMRAWSDIEKARESHANEDYQDSAKFFRLASADLQLTHMWSHIAPHYSACELLEASEALSRAERPEQSIESFRRTSAAFSEAKKVMQERLPQATGEDADELKKWIRITEDRESYSRARAELDEGRSLDRLGQTIASAKRFAQAAKILESLASSLEGVESREIGAMSLFSRALEGMANAEARGSADLYIKAAQLFKDVAGSATALGASQLATGNAHICEALAALLRFKGTKELSLYSEAKLLLEKAADAYDRAGSSLTTSWVRGTQRLLDAYAYLLDAETEKDARKKTEYYHLAEKHLELASKLYLEARYIGKSNEIERHLEAVRDEKRVLLSPIEALSDSPVAISNLTPPSLRKDQPVGLEKFVGANIQASLIVGVREIKVGDELEIEVEVLNVGQAPALLLKLEQITAGGFEIIGKPDQYRLEDSGINLRGKKLDPLKMEELRLFLRAKKKGEFPLAPRILFLDETGKYRSHQPDPVTVKVREMGITGWIKGPSK